MSWHPSPDAGSPSSTPAKRRRIIKIEDEDEPMLRDSPKTPTPIISPDFIPNRLASTQATVGSQFQKINHRARQLLEVKVAAVKAMVDGHNTFLTGSAGSSKTMVLKAAIGHLRNYNKRLRIAAPTGKAAQGVGGTTLHSFYGLKKNTMSQKSMSQLEGMVLGRTMLKQRLANTDVLVIDEISMVENIFFARLNRMMQAAKVKFDKPFGGVQIIVCGDFRQLPPVKPFSYCFHCGKITTKRFNQDMNALVHKCSQCRNEEREDHQWAFKSQVWGDLDFININLRENHRQQEGLFIEMINRLGLGRPPRQSERDLLWNHPYNVDNAIWLYGTNADVDGKNYEEFKRLGTRQHDYRCVDIFQWNPTHAAFKDFGARSADGQTLQALSDHPYKPLLQLKLGMPVMLTNNLNVQAGLVNGSQGAIVAFEPYNEALLPKCTTGIDHSVVATVDVDQEQGANIHLYMRGRGNQIFRQEQIKRHCVQENYKTQLPVVQFHNGKKVTILPDCSMTELDESKPYSLLARTQIPLLAGWAMTVHKSQGMTMDKVVFNLSKMFCAGMAYVALSRARSLFGLRVEGSDKGLDAAGADTEVTEFMSKTVWYVPE